jgi:enamine deaminase RidA (YjgF/YER057c/UK114 family)
METLLAAWRVMMVWICAEGEGLMDLADSTRRYSTGTPWEAAAGYSRAVRRGDRIYVSGTTASGESGAMGLGSAGEQARAALGIIKDAVESLGGSLSDVVRTRIYVKDIGHWESVARVHGEFFGEVRPACTLVEARLVDDSLLVEIEAEAVMADGDAL